MLCGFLRTKYNLATLTAKDNLTLNSIRDYELIILISSNLTKIELDVVSKFLKLGEKSVACLGCAAPSTLNASNVATNFGSNMCQGGEDINDFLEKYGLRFEYGNGVVRTAYAKYLHPKHALITDGILHPTLLVNSNGKNIEQYKSGDDGDSVGAVSPTFVFPNGCIVGVQSPSTPILASGKLCFPSKRPICGVWDEASFNPTYAKTSRGRLMALGSNDMFTDEWFDKEMNSCLLQSFIRYLLRESNHAFDRSDSFLVDDSHKIEDSTVVAPDTEALSGRLKWCLEEHAPLPQDVSSLYRLERVTFDSTRAIPKVMKTYEILNVKKDPLTLIHPDFDRPFPPLRPAVFRPKMMDLPSPPLEKIDLDDEFADPLHRLARLTNKCSDNETDVDLDYYILEACEIVSLKSQNIEDESAHDLLHFMFSKLLAFKSSPSMENFVIRAM